MEDEEEENDDELDDGGSADDESDDRDDMRLGRRLAKRNKPGKVDSTRLEIMTDTVSKAAYCTFVVLQLKEFMLVAKSGQVHFVTEIPLFLNAS